MPTERLKRLLEEEGIEYASIPHAPAHTTQELAAQAHVHGWELAKSTVLKLDGGRFAMAVLPAPARVDLGRMGEIAHADSVNLASEDELRTLFPDCEVGAMPPFGNLYALPVYVDARLAEDDTIVFHGGSHAEAIRMRFADYRRLVAPTITRFSAP